LVGEAALVAEPTIVNAIVLAPLDDTALRAPVKSAPGG
jgi:hypothetical protein